MENPSKSTADIKQWLLEKVIELSNQYECEIKMLRREIHQEPELAFHEWKTAKKIEKILLSMGLKVKSGIAKTGIVADLNGNGAGRTLLLRADMDALPIQEDNTLSFKSKTDGIMHACGHDVHSASLVGVAKILYALRTYWNGTVRFVFQPAEESGGGGREMIKAGILDDLRIDASMALHTSQAVLPGYFSLGWENVTSYSDRFSISIYGQKAHSAQPHKGIDAIAIAAHTITAINELLKQLDPMEYSTYSIGMIQGGVAPNIIADRVELTGMMRNVTNQTRKVLIHKLRSVAEGIAAAMGGRAEFTLFEGYPSVYNNAVLTDFVAREITEQSSIWLSDIDPELAHRDVLIREKKPILGAEDYGFYTQRIPSCFYQVGTGNQAPAHSAEFMVEEQYIKLCTRSMASLALSYLLQAQGF